MNPKILTIAAMLSTALITAPAQAGEFSSQGPNGRAYYQRDHGVHPGAVAAGVVGGVIGAAGAIATAPFRDSYAYDGAYAYDDEYRYRYRTYPGYNNGFVCEPGTTFIGQDGRPHLCQ